ncbi:GGDEF domain-containing protein (plasmid) [Actinoplanes sp. CA-051413]|uniref:GGDEF domain-containing protein n=1 Tax=Actinoplanes sp. CA-051413 TaxID=3239899 RepID=UPI003D953D1B
MKALTAFSAAVTAMATTTAGLAVYGNRRLQRRLAAANGELVEVRSVSLHDPLTGLVNRRGITADMADRMASRASWALILVDLDGFKPVNDTYGHATGDLVLAETARRLATVVDPTADLVGRLGGDEFVILAASPIPAISMMLARDAASVLREPFTVDGDVRVEVSASVGLVQVMPGDDTRAVMRSADAALYRAKAAGGNTAVEFGPAEPLVGVDVERPQLRVRDMHPHRVPAELGVVIAR